MKQSTTQKRVGGRSARVRESVIASALEELIAKGYEQFSITSVARAAGVHETSIYRRWGTRDGLIVDALQAAHIAPIPDSGSLHADLLQLLIDSRTLMETRLGRALLQLAASVSPQSEIYPVIREFWRQRQPALEAIFTRAIGRGEWNAAAPFRPLLDALMGAIVWRVNVTHDGATQEYIEDLISLHCPKAA